jgi:hypothetical protein
VVDTTQARRKFRFWYWWLLIGFCFQTAVGYSIAFGLSSWMWAWHQQRVAHNLWNSGYFSPATRAYQQWVAGPMGGTIAAWALSMCWVVAIPFRKRERWAYWCVVTSTSVWAIADTGISLVHHVWVNVVFNCGVSLTIALPLLALRSFFQKEI